MIAVKEIIVNCECRAFPPKHEIPPCSTLELKRMLSGSPEARNPALCYFRILKMKRENKLENIFYIEDNIIRAGEEKKKVKVSTLKERSKRNQGGGES